MEVCVAKHTWPYEVTTKYASPLVTACSESTNRVTEGDIASTTQGEGGKGQQRYMLSRI
jgi:hypothetical protein